MNNGANHRSTVGIAYQRWALDYVIELVQAIALDYSKEPKKYGSVPADIIDLLSRDAVVEGKKNTGLTLAARRTIYEDVLGITFYLSRRHFDPLSLCM